MLQPPRELHAELDDPLGDWSHLSREVPRTFEAYTCFTDSLSEDCSVIEVRIDHSICRQTPPHPVPPVAARPIPAILPAPVGPTSSWIGVGIIGILRRMPAWIKVSNGSYINILPRKRVADLRHVQIVQPHHPLCGQIVKVLRNARRPGADEPCWLIETPSGARQLVPQAWCQPAPGGPASVPSMRPVLALVDVTTLRRLAIMVRQRSAIQEPHHDPTVAPCPADSRPNQRRPRPPWSGRRCPRNASSRPC